MKIYLITAMVAAATITASTFALAQSYPYGYGPYGNAGYAIGPYGDALPGYTSPYGSYPPYTYDPDPGLSAQLRSDFNRGVDSAPR
jgi:hypothetical protein